MTPEFEKNLQALLAKRKENRETLSSLREEGPNSLSTVQIVKCLLQEIKLTIEAVELPGKCNHVSCYILTAEEAVRDIAAVCRTVSAFCETEVLSLALDGRENDEIPKPQ